MAQRPNKFENSLKGPGSIESSDCFVKVIVFSEPEIDKEGGMLFVTW